MAWLNEAKVIEILDEMDDEMRTDWDAVEFHTDLLAYERQMVEEMALPSGVSVTFATPE